MPAALVTNVLWVRSYRGKGRRATSAEKGGVPAVKGRAKWRNSFYSTKNSSYNLRKRCVPGPPPCPSCAPGYRPAILFIKQKEKRKKFGWFLERETMFVLTAVSRSNNVIVGTYYFSYWPIPDIFRYFRYLLFAILKCWIGITSEQILTPWLSPWNSLQITALCLPGINGRVIHCMLMSLLHKL